MKTIFLFFIFTINLSNLYSQALNYNYKKLTDENGLPSSVINFLFIDSKGYIWIGTKNGVCRWDSKNFKYYNVENGLPSNDVYSCFEDYIGNIWFGTFSSKACFYSYADDKIYNELNDKRLKINNLLNFQNVHLIGDNYLCIDKNTDFYRLVNLNTHKQTYLDYRINSHVVQAYNFDKRLLLLIEKGMLYDTRLKKFIQNNILRIQKSNSKELLYLTSSDFNFILDKTYKVLDSFHKFQNQFIFSKFNNKIYEINTLNEFKIDSKIILKNYNNFEIYNDNIFLSSKDNIAYNINLNLLQFTNKNSILYIKKDKDALYYLDNKYSFYKNSNKVSTIKQTNFYNNFNNLFVFDNKIISFKNGLQKEVFLNNLGSSNKFLNSYKSKYLLSTSRFLLYFQNIKEAPLILLKNRTYTTFVDSKDRLWFVSLNGIHFTEKFIPRITKIKTINFNTKNPLFAHQIIEDVNKNIIFATNQGVYFLDSNFNYNYINSNNLLTNNECKKIKFDPRDSSLWIATQKGINHISYKNENNNFTFKSLHKFLKTDGLSSDEINDFEFSGDTLLIANNGGIDLIRNRFLKPKPDFIPFFINDIIVNNKKVNISKLESLNHLENNIVLYYSAIYYNRRDRLKIIYKLYRNNKLIAVNESENEKITFFSLNDGKYRIELLAFDVDYKYIRSKKYNIYFNISPPFYKTWWFIFIIFIILIIFLGLIQYYRLKQKNKEAIRNLETEKVMSEMKLSSLLNQMNPHFVFNSLSTIQNLVIGKNEKDALNYIENFSVLMRKMLENSRNEIISLENEIEFLENYIYLEKIRFKEIYNFNWYINDDVKNEISEIYIPSMLIQPLIENAIKHGENKINTDINIFLSIIDNKFLELEIINNVYVNKYEKSKHKSAALILIKERLDVYVKNGFKGNFKFEIIENIAMAKLIIPI